jgi:cobalt-precorrin-5B (C1)-methyltransferase
MSDAPPLPVKKERGTRTGFTTGACAAAAAKAATRLLVRGEQWLSEIATTLPNRQIVTFALKRCASDGKKGAGGQSG